MAPGVPVPAYVVTLPDGSIFANGVSKSISYIQVSLAIGCDTVWVVEGCRCTLSVGGAGYASLPGNGVNALRIDAGSNQQKHVGPKQVFQSSSGHWFHDIALYLLVLLNDMASFSRHYICKNSLQKVAF